MDKFPETTETNSYANQSSHESAEQKGLFKRRSKLTQAAMVAGAIALAAGCSDSGEKKSSNPSDQYEGNSGGAGLTSEEEPNPGDEIQPIGPEDLKESFEEDGMEMAQITTDFITAHKGGIKEIDEGLGTDSFSVASEDGSVMAIIAEAPETETIDFSMGYVERSADSETIYNQTAALTVNEGWTEAGEPESVEDFASLLEASKDTFDVQGISTVEIKQGTGSEEFIETDNSFIALEYGDFIATEYGENETTEVPVSAEEVRETILRAQKIQESAYLRSE